MAPSADIDQFDIGGRPPGRRIKWTFRGWEFGTSDYSNSAKHRYRSIHFGRVRGNRNGSRTIGSLYLHAGRSWYGHDKFQGEHWITSFSVSLYVWRASLNYHGEFYGGARRGR